MTETLIAILSGVFIWVLLYLCLPPFKPLRPSTIPKPIPKFCYSCYSRIVYNGAYNKNCYKCGAKL